ncbi:type II secretion system F family protein [Orrella sp. JC864]|uniref:type II secretion system F family protein n=1 Tax=Orrella sp. JC864 TaxID=3120298 RepID=UPI0012BCE81E
MGWHILSVAAAGACGLLALHWLMGPLRRGDRPAAAIAALPWPWRWSWPWLQAGAGTAQRLLGWRRREHLEQAIGRAGLKGCLSAAHVAAAQWALALAGIALAWVMAVLAQLPVRHAAWLGAGLAGAAACWPTAWLRQRARQRSRRMLRELPFLLDMITLCMDAGLNVQGALQQAVERGPAGPLRDEFQAALADVRASVARLDALKALAQRTGLPALHSLVSAIVQADTLGMSLGPVLQAQSERQRAERLLRAEQQALEAPVKMLFPLIVCIFPCTFLVLGFPIVQRLLQAMP